MPAPAPAPVAPAAAPASAKKSKATAAGRTPPAKLENAAAVKQPDVKKEVRARASARAALQTLPPSLPPASLPPAPIAPEVRAALPQSLPAPPTAPTIQPFELDTEDPEELQRQAAETVARIVAQLYPDAARAGSDDNVLDSARQLLSADYYLRRMSRVGMRGRSEHVDDFGLDPAYEARVQPLLDTLYERYFRVQISGAEHIPAQGGALLVCNHGGALPWDGVMLKTALRRARPEREPLRWLTDDFVSHAPFLGAALNRIGAVRACPENAEQLLERGSLLAVFPEGLKGIEKTYKQRYQLQRFGRGGHVKLALRMGVPVLPVAIVGSEDTYPLLYRVRAFSKVFGLPFIPVTPTFPLLGPLGLLPLPSRWRIVVGERLSELDELDAYAAENGVLVNELNERLRGRVQSLLGEALTARGPNAFA
jgi:1-acyl-sn-glycerol-3-phosphate acyltransferase